MLCAWAKDDALDYWKCRACVCGNLDMADPTAQSWTAQAEPSSLLSALKFGRHEQWTVSEHDVKGAFLNSAIPDDELILVQHPSQWVAWGIVPRGVVWKLQRADKLQSGGQMSVTPSSSWRESLCRQTVWVAALLFIRMQHGRLKRHTACYFQKASRWLAGRNPLGGLAGP